MAYADLTTKQKRFVDEYVGGANGNATKAAKRAGYSEKTARQAGHENLTKPDIQAAITERLNELAMPAAEVLSRLADVARGSLADFIRILPGGKWELDLAQAEREGKLRLLHELKETEHGPQIKLHDPLTALQLLGKHHKLFVDKVEAEVTVYNEDDIAELDRKLAGLAAAHAAAGVPGEPDAGGSSSP